MQASDEGGEGLIPPIAASAAAAEESNQSQSSNSTTNYDQDKEPSTTRSFHGGENLSGYLYKKTKDGRWQKRWFESNGNFLAYYKSKKKEKLLAALSLPQTGEIRLVTGNTTGTDTQAGLFSIELNSRVYILQAKTDEEAQKWVMTLNNLKYQGYPNLRNNSASSTSSKPKIDRTSGLAFSDAGTSFTAEGSDSKSADWKKADRPLYGQLDFLCCFGKPCW